jgi:putative ABC transport system ATP-binding protein
MKELIRTEDLSKTYGKDESIVYALKSANVSFYEGEVVAIIGTSGSGKSTLLHLLGGLDTATSGKVFYNDTDILTLNDDELSKFRRKNIGFVFQFFNLIPELTAYENIILPNMIDYRKVDKQYIESITDTLNISDRLTHYPNQMSGGQQQRVAIARALANNPSILLCDEPTGNLDEKSSQEVLNMLLLLRKKFNKTIIIVTHSMEIANQCDRMVKILDGNIA